MMTRYREYQNLDGLTQAQWQALRAVYLAMSSKVDAQFGRLCQALQEAGMYEDSAIFVFSDHGDYAGDYGMAEKAQNCFEDCLTRVPFLVKAPGGVPMDPGISHSLTELVDFYATAMDFAGLSSSHDHFGRSLRPLLADREHVLREYAFCEGGRLPEEWHCDEYHQPGGRTSQPSDVYWPKKMAQKDDLAHAKATMVRSRRYKYIRRSQGRDELYDLISDPQETKNLEGRPEMAPVVAEHRMALLDWLQTTSDIVPRDFDSRMPAESLWNKVRHLVPQGMEADVREKIQSGMGIGAVFGYVFGLRKQAGL